MERVERSLVHGHIPPVSLRFVFSLLRHLSSNYVYAGGGAKACPYADIDQLTVPYCKVEQEDVRVQAQFRLHPVASSPDVQLLERTLTLWTSFEKYGCSAHLTVDVSRSYTDTGSGPLFEQLERSRRGHDLKPSCQGKLVLRYDSRDTAFVW